MPTTGSPQRLITDLELLDGKLGSLAPGETRTVPHGLHETIGGSPRPVKPTSVLPDCISPVVVTAADELTITVNNPTTDPQSVTFRAERVHTFHANPQFADDTVPIDPPFTMLLWQGNCGLQTGKNLVEDGLIYRPGVASAANHVATWAEVQTHMDAAEGALTIYIDDSVTATHVPATTGVSNCRGAKIVGYPPRAPTANLIIDDGAQLFDVREFAQVTITGNPSGAVSSLGFSFAGTFSDSSLTVRGATLVGGNGATPFISVPDGDELDLLLLETSDTTGSGAKFIQLGAGSFCVATQVESSTLLDGIIKGPIGSVLFLQFDDTVALPNSYTGFLGVYAPLALNKTTGYPHTITTSAAAFSFDSFERNDNYAVLVFGGETLNCTVTMPANPQLWEQHEIKNFDGAVITVNGNGFDIENPAIPGNYAASFVTTTVGNYRFRFFPAGFTSQAGGVWTLV